MKQKVIGNRIYRYDRGRFSVAFVDGQDSQKGVFFHQVRPEESQCSVGEICFTEDLVREANVVFRELVLES
jgi:hypothetical protein